MSALERAVGALLGWFAGRVLRIRRRHVVHAMLRAGIEHPAHAADAMYRSLGVSLVEFLALALGAKGSLERTVIDPVARERWAGALAEGRGVVVAASHTGNWDLAACAVARDVELLVVTKRLSVRWLDRIWQGTRARLGVRLSDAAGAMRRARQVLRRGGAVAMMIDQVPAAPHGVVVEFLGAPALADRAPAAMAAASRAPLVVAASSRDPSGQQTLHVLDVLRPPRRPTRAWIDEATRVASARLEAFVRARPSEWLWLHRRWRPMLPAPCTTTSSSQVRASTAA